MMKALSARKGDPTESLVGGVKCSGIGVEVNVDGLKAYTSVQVLNVAR